MTLRSAHAAIRFGLGGRPDVTIPADPAPWLAAQIRPLADAPGPSLEDIRSAFRERSRDPASRLLGTLSRGEVSAWAARMITTEEPFAERWANFWFNHLTVSRRNTLVFAMSGHYQRTAIRAHAFGRFDEMLLAAYRHPAMLGYLDQSNSVGPASRIGAHRRSGLNENLARECLELHTLTPAGGYTQADIIALARILTGWSVGRGAEFQEPPGFLFREAAHEPGEKVLLGRSFAAGEAGGEAALRFLAHHPATERALARKIAMAFIADSPPPAAIARIEGVLHRTGGDLAATAHAVIQETAAWEPLTKIKTAEDFVISVLRALGMGPEAANLMAAALVRLNQPIWTAPAPIGWPNDAASWAVPEQLMRRVDWANELAARRDAGQRIPLPALIETLLGPLARAETVTAARQAGSAREAVLLVLASPEAQRR